MVEHKLDREKVIVARQAARGGESTAALADRFGVDHASMWRALTGKTWKSADAVEAPVSRPSGTAQIGSNNGRARLTEGQVRAMRGLRDAGTPVLELAERFSVSLDTAKDVVYRRKWRHVP